MQDKVPCKNHERQLIKATEFPVKGALNKPLNNHYKFTWRFYEPPLGPPMN